MVACYGVLILIVAMAQIASVAIALHNREKVETSLKTSLKTNLEKHYMGDSRAKNFFSQTMDLVQVRRC